MIQRRCARWCLASAAAGFALLVSLPPDSRAFTTTGEFLDLTQRDLRVFDNFTDPEANANTTVEPSFPGFVGAELACWKGAIEWASELHAEGFGDPQQPGDLGSGGANFDPCWQGLADQIGGPDDNVLSEISGVGGGVIAYCETPTGDGWRIRFYQDQTFFDDPHKTNFVSKQRDLQSIACHEYGHALGLGHSVDVAATMYPGPTTANPTAWRSLAQDDIAGIQFVYGLRSAQKPHIQDYEILGHGRLLVRGSGFAALDNEVWFTQSAIGGDGTPVKAQGLASHAGGTAILLNIPTAAGRGDLLVKLPGVQHWTLSNPFPFDPSGGACFAPSAYGTAKVSSTGYAVELAWTAMPSLGLNDFEISFFGAPVNSTAVLFSGSAPRDVAFLGGRLLVAPPLRREASTSVDIFNFASVQLPITAAMVGQTRYLQVWYADPADPFGAGTTNALAVTFCP